MDKRFIFRYHRRGATGGRSRVDGAGRLDMARVPPWPGPDGKSAGLEVRAGPSPPMRGAESSIPHCREKPLSDEAPVPVPQTDTGGQVEDTEAIERTLVKELGKLTP